MASTSAKAQSLQNCTLSYDVKWQTNNSKSNNGDSDNNGSSSRSSKQRSRNFGDSSSRRPPKSDSSISKAAEMDSESMNQVFERAGNVHCVSVSYSDRWVEDWSKKNFSDRLSDKSEKKMAVGSDRVIEKSEEKKAMLSNHSIHKMEKKGTASGCLNEKSEKKTTSSDRLMETPAQKASGADRLILKYEKKATFSDRTPEKLKKKATSTPLSDQLVEKSNKKAIIPDSSVEKSEKKHEESDAKSKFLIRLKAKSKLEDDSPQQGAEAGCEGEGEDLEAKTWNLRPRKPASKKLDIYGTTPSKDGGALPQTVAVGGSSKAKKETTRVRTHADAKIAQSKEKKRVFSIALSKEEIEEDIFVMTGSKPARRPKKRAKNVQKGLDFIFPGLWLCTITPKSYKVVENHSKK